MQIPGDKLCLCYLKDADVYAQKTKKSTLPKDITITTDKLLVNNQSMEISDKVRTGLFEDVFDIAYHNDWRELDNVVNFAKFTSINSIEVIFTVKGLGGEFTISIEKTPEPTKQIIKSETTSSQNNNISKTVYYVSLLLIAFAIMCALTIYSKKQKRK